jgi:cytochrome c553
MAVPRCFLFPLLLIFLSLLGGCDNEGRVNTSTQDTIAAMPAAAPEEPELIKVCADCHRKAGRASVSFWPRLQGKSRAELISLLRAYRDERLTNAKMNKVAHTLSDEDISQLADFYAR